MMGLIYNSVVHSPLTQPNMSRRVDDETDDKHDEAEVDVQLKHLQLESHPGVILSRDVFIDGRHAG
jgi:hypothetical protein